MEITEEQSGSTHILRLVGRLDANWAAHVENAVSAAVRGGHHQLAMNLSGVPYVSSAGLRVLLVASKQLRAIKGSFAIVEPSAAVRSVLDLSGLSALVSEETAAAAPAPTTSRLEKSAHATFEIFPTAAAAPITTTAIGNPAGLDQPSTEAQKLRFDADTFALGVGALGPDFHDCSSRFGEFLAVGGIAAYQPTDGSTQPDFVVSEGGLVPEGFLLLGLTGRTTTPLFARFEKSDEVSAVKLSELVQQALALAGGAAVALTLITETSGLVGATLRKSPATSSETDRFSFPRIRDWLSFTSERGYRDTTSLIVGVAAPEGHPLASHLRPVTDGVLGHFHAASFPYRPLQKGLLELTPSLRALFDSNNVQDIVHLLADRRDFSGIGESDFLRGALWISPLTA